MCPSYTVQEVFIMGSTNKKIKSYLNIPILKHIFKTDIETYIETDIEISLTGLFKRIY